MPTDASSSRFLTFDSPADETPPGTQAHPRPADRPRLVEAMEGAVPAEFVTFDFPPADVPPGTTASPRPAGRERWRSVADQVEDELPSEVRAVLASVVRALPKEYRLILEMHLAGTAVAEIAEAVGATPERVLAAIREVRELLARDPAA